MAKSTRSKVKRHFRAKKREEGVYAATEAARLQRLNMKLRALATSKPEQEKDEDEMPVEREGDSEPGAGWSSSIVTSASASESDSDSDMDSGTGPPFWLSALGLVDPYDITAERMSELDGQLPSGEQADGGADAMDLDSGAGSASTSADKRISTHGPRNSRREQWRLSKGLPARPKSRGMNRQGLVAAKRKSGRSHRRR